MQTAHEVLKKFSMHTCTILFCFLFSLQAQTQTSKQTFSKPHTPLSCCVSRVANRFAVPSYSLDTGSTDALKKGMVWIAGGTFQMGADGTEGDEDEYPKHPVTVNGFFIDVTEVTNAQFAAFVAATGYVTTAERKPDWNQLKKDLPAETPKPPDSLLVPASLVFSQPAEKIPMYDYVQWWEWKRGADWKHPQGPGSTIVGKEAFPVVQVSYEDAQAYCRWAGKRLPTEAEWEWAARGGLKDAIYPWGIEGIENGKPKANTWQGDFPYSNTAWDGFANAAPVKSFKANEYGLYDMAGNVWEWCADYYDHGYYKKLEGTESSNPGGPSQSYDPQEPFAVKRVIRGGSFLCNDSYCSGYRVARRMKSTEDSAMEHVGFRCVAGGK